MLDERLYRSLYRIRRVEEEIARVYPTDKITSPVHLAIGQEAISVAVCEALEPEDIVFGTYRSHAYFLAKGGSLPGMIAELYGKATGVAKGKAGSMHLIDVAAGVMGASAVVASSISQAVGYALAMRMRGLRRVVVCFLGEGATEEGTFHESLNFAALKRVPLLLVCENNFYAIHSRQRDRQATSDVCGLARAHGLSAQRLEEQDPYQIYAAARQAVDGLRNGGGPVLLECWCYRWCEHVGPGTDFEAGYRDRSEAEPWIERDPLRQVAARLSPAVRQPIEAAVDLEIQQAFAAAERDPFPDAAELYTDLYA